MQNRLQHSTARGTECRQAVVLAGVEALRVWNGRLRGSKLWLPLLAETVLEHQCRWLEGLGVEHVVVALHESDPPPLRRGEEPSAIGSVRLTWCSERTLEGSAGCLRAAKRFLREEPFLILHQSVVPGALDLEPLLGPPAVPDEILRVAVHARIPEILHGVEIDDDECVRFARRHPSEDATEGLRAARCAEIYYAQPELFDEIPPSGYCDLKEQLVPRLQANGFRVRAVPIRDAVPLLDGPDDYLAAIRSLLYQLPDGRGERQILPRVWVRGEVEIAESAVIIGPVLLDDGVSLANDVRVVGPTYLGRGVTIGKGATVRESVLWAHASVGESASVDYSIVSEHRSVMAGDLLFASVRSDDDSRFGEDVAAFRSWSTDAHGRTGDRRRGLFARVAKRCFDAIVAAGALLALLPLFAVLAIAIRRDSPGPVFYTERRASRYGRSFPMVKFRTMRSDASARQQELTKEVDGPMFKISNDPRVTRVGAFLRRTSLDELPQLINVLLGHMSLVGPRPLRISEMRYAPHWRDIRLSVRPGITGLWQLRARESNSFGDWIRWDCEYVLAQQSFWRDLLILAETGWRFCVGSLSGR